jgi:hypothetical protein
MRLALAAPLAALAVITTLSAATAQQRSITGVWTSPGQGCKREDGALTIKPMALEGEDVSCKFSTVKRTGKTVVWTGICDGAEGADRQRVTATEANGKLTISYHPGGNVLENLERCPR